MEVVIVVIVALFLYLLIKPKSPIKRIKSKEEKQKEIIKAYENFLNDELTGLSGDEYIQKKTTLLKKISKELHNNLFFDEDEVRSIVQNLAK